MTPHAEEPGRERLIPLDLPEQGSLALPLAGLGRRAVAALIDAALLLTGAMVLVFVLALALAVGALDQNLGMPATVAVLGLLPIGGPLVLELVWRGQSPGKRSLGLRVVAADGGPASPSQLLLRNIVRLVDFLPFGYLAGVITVFASGRSQRLGDLVGGTLVIREDPAALAELHATATLTVPAALRGVPEPVLRAAQLLGDPTRVLSVSIRAQRRREITEAVRYARPDLSGEDDDALWARLQQGLRASE